MGALIKELTVQGETIAVYEGGFIQGVKAAVVQYTGPEQWGVTCNIARSEVDTFLANEEGVNQFILDAKVKLGIDEKAKFTRRELEVMHAVSNRLSNFEIADRLFISEFTVKSHLYQIYKKTNVGNRRELIAYISQQNLFSGEEPCNTPQ